MREGEKAKKILPDDATIRLNIANILGKLERFEKAEAEFKRAAELDPTNPTIFTNLGREKINFLINFNYMNFIN